MNYKRHNKIYDVSFRPAIDALFSVSAHSKKEAAEIAERELNKMSRADLIKRLLNAISFEGLTITSVCYVEDDDYPEEG